VFSPLLSSHKFITRRYRSNERLSAATPQESILEIIENPVSWNRSNLHTKVDHENVLRRNIIYGPENFVRSPPTFLSFVAFAGERANRLSGVVRVK
jgi:hypothetical protein